MSARHGTRNPSKAAIKIITKRLPDLAKIISDENSERLGLCDKDVKALLRWKIEMDPSEEKKLHPGKLRIRNADFNQYFRMFPFQRVNLNTLIWPSASNSASLTS